MKILDKIFLHRQQKTSNQLTIHIFDPYHHLTSNQILQKIRQIVRNYYNGPSSEAVVVARIKKATGLKAGSVSLKYNSRKNIITVFYCCSSEIG